MRLGGCNMTCLYDKMNMKEFDGNEDKVCTIPRTRVA